MAFSVNDFLDRLWRAQGRHLWWGVIGLHLLVIWGSPYFLTQDGSAHLYTASVFIQLCGENSPQLQEVFEFNAWYVPVWGGGLILAGLMAVFGVFVAEKVLLSMIVVLTACGFKCLIKSIGIHNAVVPFLILPFLFNHLLLMGLYYFLLALAFSFWLFAWAYRLVTVKHCRTRNIITLALGFLVVFYIHPLPPALTGLALVIFSLLPVLSHKSRLKKYEALKRFLYICVAGVPSAIIGIIYLASSRYDGPISGGRGWGAVLEDLAAVSLLVSFQTGPQWWTLLCGAVLLVISLRMLLLLFGRYSWQQQDLWLGFSLLLIPVMSLVPEGVTGGTLMSFRLGLIFWICWCVWVGSRIDVAEVRWMRHGVAITFMLASVFQVGNIYLKQREIQPFLERLEQVSESIPDHTQVWPMVENIQGERVGGGMWSPRTPYLVHVGLRFIAPKQDVASMISYQGEVSHFMVRFKERAPSRFFQMNYEERPQAFLLPASAQGWKLRIGIQSSEVEAATAVIPTNMTRFGGIVLQRLPEQ